MHTHCEFVNDTVLNMGIFHSFFTLILLYELSTAAGQTASDNENWMKLATIQKEMMQSLQVKYITNLKARSHQTKAMSLLKHTGFSIRNKLTHTTTRKHSGRIRSARFRGSGGGVIVPGGGTTPLNTDRQTPVKTLSSRNLAGGKKNFHGFRGRVYSA